LVKNPPGGPYTADWYDSYSYFQSIPGFVMYLGTLNVKMMNRKFAKHTLNDLLEKLSDCTLKYSHMHLAGGREQDYYRLKMDILELQQEIVRRKESEDSDRPSPSSGRNSSR
jgi:hypothetical protein